MKPLFLADWERVVFIHYETPPSEIQANVPFELELFDGRAFVSLVAFTMSRLRLACLPRLSRRLLRPISDHHFLNVRAYVRHRGESGIYFLAEYLANRLVVPFGRPLFGLPYEFAGLSYWHDADGGAVSGVVCGRENLRYEAHVPSLAAVRPCARGSLDEFLLERYTAFTHWRGVRRFFRVRHEPWPVVPIDCQAYDSGLLEKAGIHGPGARLAGAHFSPGVRDVWMGAPQFTAPYGD